MDDLFKVKVRLMKNTKTGEYWYEELVGENWVQIKETLMHCDGNATFKLHEVLNRKREEIYKSYVKQIGEEQEFNLEI